MKEEIKDMLFKLKRQNTFNDIGYFKTALSNEDVDLLLNYIEKLENNWKELKKFVDEEIKHLEKSRYVSFNTYGENKLRIFKDFQFKMQEIESGNNDE